MYWNRTLIWKNPSFVPFRSIWPNLDAKFYLLELRSYEIMRRIVCYVAVCQVASISEWGPTSQWAAGMWWDQWCVLCEGDWLSLSSLLCVSRWETPALTAQPASRFFVFTSLAMKNAKREISLSTRDFPGFFSLNSVKTLLNALFSRCNESCAPRLGWITFGWCFDALMRPITV